MQQPGNAIDARELSLYATNHRDIYRQRVTPIIANLNCKIKRGIYDADKAQKLWRYVADDAAKAYSREFGPCNFSVATRQLAAIAIGDYYADCLEFGSK